VLFAPGGDVQEAGASNFLAHRPKPHHHGAGRVVVRCHADSTMTIAREQGYEVEERT
jgi:hypothetical protein